eukprot:TRINITY_DN42267_c0_g1_i1.p1 TRINITY_DN42267_c0_g1~~TRINITY_DN42267_c0_g1_i1.p1  ORF type:complete len:556 (+),score=54.07 TRINITY_DN42267_c0_g1_i1:60-1670(+)
MVGFFRWSFALLLASVTFVPSYSLRTINVKIDVSLHSVLSKTDSSFICVCLDWWPDDKCDYGLCPWGQAGVLNLDFENPRLVNAVKALSAAAGLYLRIGGSLADTITYQVAGTEFCPEFQLTNKIRLGYALEGPCLPMHRWASMNKICDLAGCRLVFGVNALKGRTYHGCAHEINCLKKSKKHRCCSNFTDSWNGSNAKALFQYTKDNLSGFSPPFALEFGNELTGPHGIQAHFKAHEYARDFKAFAKIVREVWPGDDRPKLVAADVTVFEKKYVSKFLSLVGDDMDIFTYHQYFLGAGVDPLLRHKVMSPDYLDRMKDHAAMVNKTVSQAAPKTSIWMGETGGAFNSGHDLVTNAFMSGFWYLDNMAIQAQNGHRSFCRQTLVGGFYGLLNATSLRPNPDFYAALIWTRLMGQKVLLTSATGPNTLRAYAHCTRGVAHAVTLLILNLAHQTIVFTSSFSKYSREEYHFNSTDLDSRHIYLNGERLSAGEDGTIPDMKPVVRTGVLEIQPLTYAFIVVKGIEAAACGGDSPSAHSR